MRCAPSCGATAGPSFCAGWVLGPTQSETTDSDYEVREGRMQTVSQLANAGARLKPLMHREGIVSHASLPAVLGKTRRTEVELMMSLPIERARSKVLQLL